MSSKKETEEQFRKLRTSASPPMRPFKSRPLSKVDINARQIYHFTWLSIEGDEITMILAGEKEFRTFKLAHDCTFFNVPEVTYHADAKQITVLKEGRIEIESLIRAGFIDKISVYGRSSI